MLKRENKRGQFYLIAAFIIIFVMTGFFVVSNYAEKKEKKTRIYDLGDELKIETGKVYDYGVYNGISSDDMGVEDGIIDEWAENYSLYTSDNLDDWILVYGNKQKVNAVGFTRTTVGTISLNIGGSITTIDISDRGKKQRKDLTTNNDTSVKVKFLNAEHEFNLKDGQNFYFIIKKGDYVARG